MTPTTASLVTTPTQGGGGSDSSVRAIHGFVNICTCVGTFVSLSIPNATLWMWASVVSNLRVHDIQLIRQWISEVLIRVHRLVMDVHAQYAVEIEQF